MKTTPKRALILLVLMVPLTLSGCWDRTEVNDIAIALGSSVDRESDGLYRVSVQLPLPGQMGGAGGGGGGTSGKESYYVDSEVGSTIRDANAKLQTRLSRTLFFAHRRVMVISDQLAKEGIRDLFDALARVPENRLTSNIVIAEGKGYDLLNAQPRFERFSSEAMREILESEYVVNINMKDVAQLLAKTGTDPILPVMKPTQTEKGKQKSTETNFVGYAQFHDGKMVNVITGEASEGIHWIRQKFRPYITTVDVPNMGKVTLEAHKGTIDIKPKLEADHVHFDVRVEAYSYMLEAMSAVDFELDRNVRAIEKAFGDRVKESIQSCFDQMQEYQSDSASLGLLISRTYPRQWQEKYNGIWYDELKKATFSISVDPTVSRVGLISRNISKREDAK